MADHPQPETPGALLATGRTAEVYAWGDRQVLKLMYPAFGADQAAGEAVAARIAAEAGIGAPAFGGVVTVGDRTGLAYERLDGPPMVERLTAAPWRVIGIARDFGRLHAAMHAADAPGLPDIRDVISNAVRASGADAATQRAALDRLDRLPTGDSLLHGDMHPANVLLTSTGPRVIDWIQAARGTPAADVARTLFLIRDSGLGPAIPMRERVLVSILRRSFAAAYLRAYRRLRPLDAAELRAWRLPVLVARMAEGVAGERQRLDRLVEAELR